MRRFLLIFLAVVAVIVVGLMIATRVYLRSDSVRQKVAARLESVYGGRVEVEDTDIGVLGDSTLSGLRFYEPGKSDEPPLVTIGRVKTDVSALDLLRGVMPKDVTLTDLAITLHLDRDGQLRTKLPENRKGETTVPTIHVEGGQVTVRQDGRPELVVKGVRAEVRPEGDRLPITGTVSDSEWGEWSIDGSADRKAGSLTVTLKNDHAEVTRERLLSLPVVPTAVWQEVDARGRTAVEFTFRHDPQAKRVNHYRVELHPDGAMVAVPALALKNEDVHGGITIEDELVTLTKVSGKAVGGALEVDGTLDFRGKEQVYHLEVTATRLDVGQVPEAWGLDGRLRRLGGQLSGKADLTVRYDGEVHTSGDGKGQITGVMLGGQPTTIELSLQPTRKGFGLGQRSPPQGRLPDEGRSRLPGGTSAWSRPAGGTYPAALILFQTPEQESPSFVRDVTGAITNGVKAAAGAFLDVGRKVVGSLPRGDVFKSAPANTPPTYLDVSLSLKNVDLARLVEDLQVKVPFAVSGRLTMTLQASLPVNQANDLKLYKVSGSATLPTFSLSGVDMKDVTARVRYEDGVLRLENLSGRLAGGATRNQGTFQGTARLDLIPQGDLTADLTLTEIPLAQLMRAVGVKEEVAGAVRGSANLRVPSGKLRDLGAWEGAGKLSADRVSAYGWSLTDASATVAVGKGMLTVRNVAAKLEGSPISGSAEAKLTAPYTYGSKLELAKGDLASLQRLAPAVRPPLAVAGQFGITAAVNGVLSPFSATVSGNGTGKDVKIENVSVDKLGFRWSLSGDSLKLSDVKAGLYGGEVTGTAAVPLSAKVEGKVALRIEDVDAGALFHDVPAVPLRLEGKVGGTVKGTLPATANSERSFDADVDLSSPKLRVQGLPAEKLTGTLNYRKGVGEYHLKGDLLGGTFDLDGRIPPRPAAGDAPPAKPALPDSSLHLRGAQLGRLGEALGSRETLDPLHGRIDLDVDYRLMPTDYLPVGTGSVRVTRLRWGDVVIAESLRGDVLLTDGEVRLRNLSGDLGGGTVGGRVVLRLRDLKRSSFNISLDAADAARVLAPWPSLAGNVTGSLDARLRGTLGRQWSGGGNVVLTRGKVAGIEVSEWRIPLRFDVVPNRGRAEITFEDMSAQVARGRVSGHGTFGFGSDTHLDGKLRFSGVELRGLLRPLAESNALGAGLASGRIDIAGSNVRSLDDVTATVDASFAQAQALQLPILSSLVPFVGRGQSNSTFQSGELRGRLANGIFRVQRLSLSGNALNLFAQGNVTTTGRLNFDVTATTGVIGVSSGVLRTVGLRLPAIGPIPLALLVEVTNYFSSSSVHLLVGGTVRTPVVRVEPLSLLTEEAARFFLLRAGAPLP